MEGVIKVLNVSMCGIRNGGVQMKTNNCEKHPLQLQKQVRITMNKNDKTTDSTNYRNTTTVSV